MATGLPKEWLYHVVKQYRPLKTKDRYGAFTSEETLVNDGLSCYIDHHMNTGMVGEYGTAKTTHHMLYANVGPNVDIRVGDIIVHGTLHYIVRAAYAPRNHHWEAAIDGYDA